MSNHPLLSSPVKDNKLLLQKVMLALCYINGSHAKE